MSTRNSYAVRGGHLFAPDGLRKYPMTGMGPTRMRPSPGQETGNLGKKKNEDEPEPIDLEQELEDEENDIENRLPIWEQATLGGALAVTYARAEMTIAPVKIMFGPARTLEGLGYNVPEFALKGKKVPVGGKMCALLFQSGSKETILAHGSVISSIAELAKYWSEKGSSGWEENGCDVIEHPKDLEERTYQVLKGEGQYGQLWLERVH